MTKFRETSKTWKMARWWKYGIFRDAPCRRYTIAITDHTKWERSPPPTIQSPARLFACQTPADQRRPGLGDSWKLLKEVLCPYWNAKKDSAGGLWESLVNKSNILQVVQVRIVQQLNKILAFLWNEPPPWKNKSGQRGKYKLHLNPKKQKNKKNKK